MMWKKFLSSIGIGSVKIDTVIPKRHFIAGEVVDGEVIITGGQVAVPIQSVVLQIVYQFEEIRDDSDFSIHEKELNQLTIHLDKEILSGETVVLPFQLPLEQHCPVTEEKKQTFLRTTAIIPQSVDATDQDEIIIKKDE
ncbi:sporulation protein [Bacillus sp. FJAT-52991]|uniref:Sporulation protein n=1 Tax=Bacillus kandeliae TaxID=3129297 RepID=A0ABZ2NBD0_9BACI